MTTMFPRTIEAMKKRDGSQWEIGDALIQEVGEGVSGQGGGRDGSRAILQELMEEAGSIGYDYSLSALSQLRHVAMVFTTESRDSVLPWAIHRIAGSPQMLSKIKAIAIDENIKLTMVSAGELKKRIKEGMPPASSIMADVTAIQVKFNRIKEQGINWEDKDLEEPALVEKILEAIESMRSLLKDLAPRSHIQAVGG